MSRSALLPVLGLLLACDGSSGGGKNDSGAIEGEVNADPEYAESPAYGIPCGQILDCYSICAGDEACANECYAAANYDSQALLDTLDDCFVANGCSDYECIEQSCPEELAACEGDVPVGGAICLSEGIYEVCDSGGLCNRYTATGAGWGATLEFAEFWANSDCTLNMTSLIIINNINDTAGVVVQCEATACGANE